MAAGCGDQSRGGVIKGDTLTIFTSVPLQGPHAGQARDIIDGEKLALSQAGGKAGPFNVSFAALDDSAASGSRQPGWGPGKTADNATRAAEDARTIAYVGEFDSGATAVSLPITNEADFVQVSPAATAVGLTKLVPGADKGEPDKYYPSGDRTFARVVPAGDVEASAAASWAKQLGIRSVFLVGDKSVSGDGQVKQFRVAADRIGELKIVGEKGMDPRADRYRAFAKEVASKDPDLVYFGGGVESNAVKFWKDLAAGVPRARLMGTSGLLTPDFYGAIGSAGGRTFLTSATEDESRLPAAGKRVLRDFSRQFRRSPGPYAAYGHAAMSLLLDAIKRAGDSADERRRIVDEVFSTEGFRSAVGTFSIDDNGDTTLNRIAGYTIRNGKLRLVRPLTGQPSG